MNRAQRRQQKKATKQQSPQTAEEALKLALTHLDKGELAEAEDLCLHVHRQLPKHLDTLNYLGIIEKRKGDLNAAIAYFKKALDVDPSYVRALYNLGNLMQEQGYPDQAQEFYESVLNHDPEHHNAAHKLSEIYVDKERPRDAFLMLKKLVHMLGPHDPAWYRIMKSIPHARREDVDPQFIENVTKVITSGEVAPMYVNQCAVPALNIAYPELALLVFNIREYKDTFRTVLHLKATVEQLNTPLLIALLAYAPISAYKHEFLFTYLRKALLEETLEGKAGEELKSHYDNVLTALACSCNTNEFVYYIEADEKEKVAALREKVVAAEGSDLWETRMLMCYEQIFKEPYAPGVSAALRERKEELSTWLADLAIDELLMLENIKPQVKALTEIDDEISQAVREQYEENPYPRWRAGISVPVMPPQMVMYNLFPNYDFSGLDIAPRPKALIAGCGTGHHALMVACRFTNVNVLAVDLSISSLSYSIYKTLRLGVKNVDFKQADILKLGQLDSDYDIVESVGVLHHMKDPLAGWRIITDRLKPGGIMKIGLYSEIARESIVRAREMIAERKLEESPETIREFRQEILMSEKPTRDYAFCGLRDFYSMSECRDLLFHRQEHRFTIPQIKQIIADLGLKFIGFEVTDKVSNQRYSERFPDDPTRTNLDNWHQLEQELPATFRGMYQFWLYKPKDAQ